MQSPPPPPYARAVAMGHTSLVSAPADAKHWPLNTAAAYSPPASPSDVPTAVATLLGLTKQLQDVLRLWSLHSADDSQVSDAYILVAMQFNATVHAFARYHVDLSDLFSIPAELRNILESCLGQDPCPRTLDRYMPAVRAIVYTLLQGLQSRQGPYKKAVEEHHHHSHPSPVDGPLSEFTRTG